jgi:recombination protein RecT
MANFSKTESGTAVAATKQSFSQLMSAPNVKGRLDQILQSKAPGFIASVINAVNGSKELRKIADLNPESIIRSAIIAATLDLPIDKNLGFANIIPYSGEAQFQIGSKGFIQLGLRTAQYSKMNLVDVYQDQFKSWNPLTETLDADFTVQGEDEIVGFAFYFRLINGFEKVAFEYKKDLLAHGKKYSKTFTNGPWQTHPNEMCRKTLAKKTLKQWGIMSVEMQTAVKVDQAAIRSEDLGDDDSLAYIDNPGFSGETIEVATEGSKN